MAGGFATLDTLFQSLNQNDSTEKKVTAIVDYLIRLQEQLQYVMYNLGVENFNPESVKELGEIINAPMLKEIATIKDAIRYIDGNVDSAMGLAVEAKSNIVKIWQALAPVETGSQATRAYQTGDLLVYIGYLFKAVTAIQIGDTLEFVGSGRNIEMTSLDEIIKAIAGSQT